MTRAFPGRWIKNKFRLLVHSFKASYNISYGNESTYFDGSNIKTLRFTRNRINPVIFSVQQEYPVGESYQTVEED